MSPHWLSQVKNNSFIFDNNGQKMEIGWLKKNKKNKGKKNAGFLGLNLQDGVKSSGQECLIPHNKNYCNFGGYF